jgi:hypothetical protein
MRQLRSFVAFGALQGILFGLLLKEGLRVWVERLSLLAVLRFEGLAVLRFEGLAVLCWAVSEIEFFLELFGFLLRFEFFLECGRDFSSRSSESNSFSLFILFRSYIEADL